jgi:hypothetical protein
MGARPPLHLQKLCVGADTVEDLEAWRREVAASRAALGLDPALRHVTRTWPKRADEILRGGSLYWVIRGAILARQRVLEFEPADEGDGVARCAIVLDAEVVRTVPTPRRPFQGWRYLDGAQAPDDLPRGVAEPGELPPELQTALAELGVVRRRA